MNKTINCFMAAACLSSLGLRAADQPTLNESRFQDQVRSIANERKDVDRLRRAKEFASTYLLSSLQVKAIASRLGDDAARLEFATAAYPQTVDPENFYEVYDAFTTFSKVLRLHDRVRAMSRPGPRGVPAAPQPVSAEEIRPILQSLRRESFDQTRLQVARQILNSTRQPFLAAQVKQMLDCFDFEPNKLELAKFAYSFTLDQDKYFVVNDAFSFPNSKAELARYIESQNPKTPKSAQ
jgi:hypothetical protein